ncbi:hypothetical protein Q763_17635 [Flavobacterium beibuense F44-8]|uniref:Uncharacterized protein n=1 Tax=Flavobacterium beibuense F44-8 TaxID=1406840 RepID=A0A0A2LHG4_9FLAO|nr:hypothetical protein [Flavobacterium beibuense]KGO78608.1 hypothetical protein Q763_17635 [Flavobacterium beibuense F44-8]
MKFTSLQDAYKNYIQSFPEFTHLDLTANEIKLIELILSYTRRSLNFYMNYSDIADYLVVKKGKAKAKVVEKIIRGLGTKGYIIKETKHNYNGKQGGSSTTISVNETFLEEQLHRAFNPERFTSQPDNTTIAIETRTTTVTNETTDLGAIKTQPSIESVHTPPESTTNGLWWLDEPEDEIKYIDASMAKFIAYDGISVQVKNEPENIISKEENTTTETASKPQLSKEKIKNHLRNLLTKEEYRGHHGIINIILNEYDKTKNDEEYNDCYKYILEILGLG